MSQRSMVTKESFVNLESRVVKLEEKVANRGLRLRGFKEDDLDKHRKIIDDLMSKLGLDTFTVDNVDKGFGSQRTLSDI